MMNLFNKPARLIAATAGMATLVACAPESGVGQFWREAGSQLDQGEFGNATLHNQLAQTCNQGGFKGKGTAPADPLVVLDPASTPARPVYRVHCSGQLDGKYARVLYGEYIASGTQEATVEEANAE